MTARDPCKKLTDASIVKAVVRMFKCDTARIVRANKALFLLLGVCRNTKDDQGHWYKNGKVIDFDYTEEKVIASGKDRECLMKSASAYKCLLKGKGAFNATD